MRSTSRREVAEHGDRRVAQPLVFLEMAAGEDAAAGRARLRPPSRHAAMHAERLRLIGGREHHAAADRDRLAAQRRVEQLLDRRVEGVEVGMQNGRRGLHLESATGEGTNEEPVAGWLSSVAIAIVLPQFPARCYAGFGGDVHIRTSPRFSGEWI